MASRAPRQRFGILVVCLLCAARADAQQDDLNAQLGLGRSQGSLPLWTSPELSERNDLGHVAKSTRQGVFLVGHPKAGFATAFIVSRVNRLLATNAHVADGFHGSGEMLAIMNGTSTVFKVERVWFHPGVERFLDEQKTLMIRSRDPKDGDVSPMSPDVALLQLTDDAQELPVEFAFATPQEVRDAFATPVGILGFPSHDTTSWPGLGERAQATYHDGVISRQTDFRMNASLPAARLQFLQHTIQAFGGFSGSPVFLPNGHVVAIHNSRRGVTDRSMYKSLSYAVRIDCLWELVLFHGLEDLLTVPVTKSDVDLERFSKPDPNAERFRKVLTLVDEAWVLNFQENFAEAAKKCNEAIKIAPGFAPAYDQRMMAFNNYASKYRARIPASKTLELAQLALKDARTYLQLAPSDRWALVRYASSLSGNAALIYDRDRAKARADITRAIRLIEPLMAVKELDDQTLSECFAMRGIARANLDDHNGGLADLNEAVRLFPYEPNVFICRAQIWEMMGRPQQARADRRRAEDVRRSAELSNPR